MTSIESETLFEILDVLKDIKIELVVLNKRLGEKK
jgi:hypothetical protein